MVVHSSLGQRFIRHEWEASLPDVGLSKTLRTNAQRHFRRGQYLIGERFVPPTKRQLFVGGTNLSLIRSCSLWEWVEEADATSMNFLNPTSRRDASHPQLISISSQVGYTHQVDHIKRRFFVGGTNL